MRGRLSRSGTRVVFRLGMIVSYLGTKGGTGTTTLAVNGAADIRRLTNRPTVVVDLKNRFVCLGTLQEATEHLLEMRNADLHDLDDTQTSRENYVAASAATGIKRNRRRIWIVRAEVIAISLLDDVVDE